MLVLLPPSEGKRAPDSGRAVDLNDLHFRSLTSVRRAALAATVTLCRGDIGRAREVLGVGPSLVDEVLANRSLRTAPAAPAWQVYSGVLYDALDAASMSAGVRRRLAARVAIASGLWGMVMAGDRIPAYRLSGDVTLPGVGPLAAAWRAPVGAVLAEERGLIVDMRSSSYVALGPLPECVHERAVSVSVFEVKGGRRVTVSHHNKATKGRLVRALLEHGAAPRTAADLVRACSEAGFTVELRHAPRGPARLDVLMSH